METGLDSYRNRFVDFRTGLSGEVDRGVGLIEELLKKLDCTETALKQTKLDFENECEARRRLQQEAQKNREWQERHGRRPFLVALIDADADGYVFHDRYIAKGEKGGEEAADELLAALKHYLQEVPGATPGMDILVKAFANVSGLGGALERDGRLKDVGQFRAFATGFSNRQAFFDIVDVGPGKERADFKIRENIKLFVESFQCIHLVVACGHDAGYAPFLGQFVGNRQVAERITLLEGSPFPPAIRDLGFKKTRFVSVFNEVAQPETSAGFTRPAWGRGVPSNAVAGNRRSNGASQKNVGPILPGVPTGPGVPPTGYHNPKVQSERLGPVLKNKDGHRVDRPLQVDEAVVERMKKGVLCYHLFLRGECIFPACKSSHVHRLLSDKEFDALWSLARQGRCFKTRTGRNGCSDAMCIYGHNGRAD